MKRPTRTKLLIALSVTMLAFVTGCNAETIEEKPPIEEPIQIEGFDLDFDLITDSTLKEVLVNDISVAIMESVKRMKFDHVEIHDVDLTYTGNDDEFTGELTGLAFEKDNDTPSQLYVGITDNNVTLFNAYRSNHVFGTDNTGGHTPNIFNTYETPHGQKIVIFEEAFDDEDIYWEFSDSLFDDIEELIKDFQDSELEIYDTDLTVNADGIFSGDVFADLVHDGSMETFNLTIEDGEIVDIARYDD